MGKNSMSASESPKLCLMTAAFKCAPTLQRIICQEERRFDLKVRRLLYEAPFCMVGGFRAEGSPWMWVLLDGEAHSAWVLFGG